MTFIDTWGTGRELLLLGHTNGATTTTGGLGVLATHTQTEKRAREKKHVRAMSIIPHRDIAQ